MNAGLRTGFERWFGVPRSRGLQREKLNIEHQMGSYFIGCSMLDVR